MVRSIILFIIIFVPTLVWCQKLSSLKSKISFIGPGYVEDKNSLAEGASKGQIREGQLATLSMHIVKHSSQDNYILNKLKIEVIYGRGPTALVQRIYLGLNSLNQNFFSECNRFAEADDRFVIHFPETHDVFSMDILRRENLNLSTIIAEAMTHEVYYGNAEIHLNNVNGKELITDTTIQVYKGKVSVHGKITLKNCVFVSDRKLGLTENTSFKVENVHFSRLIISEGNGLDLTFANCLIDTFQSTNISGGNLSFLKTEFKDASISASELGCLSFVNCRANSNSTMQKSRPFEIYGNYDKVLVQNSSFVSDRLYTLGPQCKSIRLTNNSFNGTVDFNALSSSNSLYVTENNFANVSLSEINFPTASSEFPWSQLTGYKLVYLDSAIDSIYLGKTDAELSNRSKFNRLIKSYQKMFNHYREIGDTESANASYSEKKDLEGRRLRHLYKSNGGFKNYISWKLNRLMKFYTDHGTDPSKAIVISIWVIALFGLFYFFFPSDWDVASKKVLIANYKDFIEKNDKGYFKPFLTLTSGILLSLLNGFALSLNAFVTLGFGNIPTHGIARYVTIVQGVIGWFLLSIFTVALINQVLA